MIELRRRGREHTDGVTRPAMKRQRNNQTNQHRKNTVMKTITMKTKTCLVFVALAAVLALTTVRAADLTPAETKAIAEEGFIYGLPIVMNYAVMYEYAVDKNSGQFKAPFNQINNEARVFTYKDTAIVTPNSDTPYSLAVAGPARRADRALGPGGGEGALLLGACSATATPSTTVTSAAAPPAMKPAITWWSAPTGRARPRRHQEGVPFHHAVLAGGLSAPSSSTRTTCRTWSRSRPATRCSRSPRISSSPRRPRPRRSISRKINKEMVKTGFFEYLDFALQFAPAGPEEKEIRAKLARIGIGAGKKFDFKDALARTQGRSRAGHEGRRSEDRGVSRKPARRTSTAGRSASLFGDRAFFNGDWLMRAAAAKGGIYGNDAVEAMYPMTKTLADGEPLDGSKHNYTLTFPAGQLPPVNAFWSVTMYDGKTQLLIKNPINRYLINSPMLPDMKKNADGSLTIYIQKDSPGADKESNWLPAPNDLIYLVMRLYWPKTEAPSILPPAKARGSRRAS